MPPKSPLPQRGGLDAAWMRTGDRIGREPPPWATMRDWLQSRLKEHFDADIGIAEGRFVYEDGSAVLAEDRYLPHTFVWFHRDLADEMPVPGRVHIIYRDERIVVVDKPPFLSTIPRGRHVVESVVVRLRDQLGLPELTPAHRLDRVTSGLLLLVTEKRWRGAYQTLFQHGEIQKGYRAVAALRDDLRESVTVRSHIKKEFGVMQAEEVAGLEPNAVSIVQLESVLPSGVSLEGVSPVGASPAGEREADSAALATYRLTPLTGKTHQLRMHMLRLGVPILGDPLYPVDRKVPIDDFSEPLQLLASDLAFTDPVDGSARSFVSDRTLPLTPDV